MMAANHCLISIGVKKQSESQHCFAQIWRLVLWQFLQLLCCPIIVQIGSGWESCGWSLPFWAPNPGFHVLHLGVTKSTSPRRWPLRHGHDAAQRRHGVPRLQQRGQRCGAPRIWVELLGTWMQNPNLEAHSQWRVAIFLVDDVFIAFPCYSFCSTERSRVWLLLSCLREPDCSPDSICFCKLLSCPA